MELTKIAIENYKSIKKSVEIAFLKDLPTVLIGKNGSGKTNALEAVASIAAVNCHQYWAYEKGNPSYRAYIQLSKEDVDRLLPGVVYDKNKCELVAYNSDKGLMINRVSSEYIVDSLKQEIVDIRELAVQLENALDTYEKQLIKISHDGYEELPIRCYKLLGSNGGLTDYDSLNWRVSSSLKRLRENLDTIFLNFSNDDSALEFAENQNLYWNNFMDISFQLKYKEPALAKFEEKFISINKTAIKREITRINKKTKESCERIDGLVKEIKERTERLHEGLNTCYSKQQEDENKYFPFLRQVQHIIGNRCLFLKNESSEVLFRREDRTRYYDNRLNSVMETYLRHVYTGNDRDELLKELGKEFTFSEQAISDFETYLNEHIPDFDKGMYESISVQSAEQGEISIFLNEKSGEKIALNDTSAGRRWYFSYYFMKNMLSEGDIFIIDEPAATLHPSAQKEVLEELIELTKRGIKVVYSTHSPYLIPDDRKCVHFVTMTDEGTMLRSALSERALFSELSEIVGVDIFDIQTVYDTYIQGDPVKIASKCYEALNEKATELSKEKKEKKRGEEKFSDIAKELNISVDTIKSWNRNGEHFRSPKFENVLAVCKYLKIKITAILE